MLDPKIVRLMNQELDGINSAGESGTLKAALEEDKDIREYFRDLSALDGLIRNNPVPEPGSDFKDRVIRELRLKTTAGNTAKEKNTMTKKQKGFSIAAVVVAAAAAVLFFINPGWLTKNAGEEGMSGTIVKADRYRTGAMTAKDVVLTKADVVKILQDPNFQNLIRNVRFQKLVQDPQFASLLKGDSTGATRLLGDPKAAQSFEAVARLLAKPYVSYDIGFASLAGNAGFIGFLNDDNFAKIAASGDLSEIVKSAAFFELLKNPKFGAFLQKPEFKTLVGNKSFISYIGNEAKYAAVKSRLEVSGLWDSVIEAQASGNFSKLESNSAFKQIFLDPSFASFLKDPDITSLHKGSYFVNVIEMENFPELVKILYSANIFFDGGASFASLVNNSSFSELLKNLDFLSPSDRAMFCDVLADANFTALMNDASFRAVCQNPKFAEFVKALATAGTQIDGVAHPDDPGFAALAKNSFFFALVQNPSFQKVCATPAFIGAIGEGGFRTLLNNPYFSSLVNNLGPYLAFSAPRFNELFKNIAFANLLTDKNFQGVLALPSFRNVIWSVETLNALARAMMKGGESLIEIDGPDFASLSKNAAFTELLATPQFKALLANPEYRTIWNIPSFSQFLASANMDVMMKMDKIVICALCFTNLMANEHLSSLLQSSVYSIAVTLSDPSFTELAQSLDAMKVLCSMCFSNFIGLVQDPKLVSLIKNDSFFSLMNEPGFASLLANGTLGIIWNNPNFTNMLNTTMAPFQNAAGWDAP